MASVSWQTAARDSSLGTATANTLNALYRNVPVTPESPSLPTFIPTATTLVAAGTSPPDRESLEFMRQITSGAQATAVSNFHDSILAGPFSEASNGEFTDIGLWLGSGHYQKGQEKAILGSLGLEEWTRYARGRITTRQFDVPAECDSGFSTAYRNLKDVHCFCVSSGGVTTACFLLGETHQQWCGLASIAIVSD
ncbi:hypothetical protein V8E55_004555 [Tylopilus felleus]